MAWIELEHLSHCYQAGTEQEHRARDECPLLDRKAHIVE